MLNDEAEGVRIMAADVSAALRLSSAVPLLIKNLNDATPVVRRAAATALGNIGAAEQALPELEKLASDQDQTVTAAVQEAVAKIKAYAENKQAEKAKLAAKTPAKKAK
jgi:HEAT repeat protein